MTENIINDLSTGCIKITRLQLNVTSVHYNGK